MGINTIGGLNLKNTQIIICVYMTCWMLLLAYIDDSFPPILWHILLSMILFVGFFNIRFSLDTLYFWDDMKRLIGLNFHQFLTTYTHTQYTRNHPPFFTYLITKCRYYWVWQCLTILVSISDLAMLGCLYGWKTSFIIAATPLFCLMRNEPSNDFYAYSSVLLSLFISQYSLLIASILYGFSFFIKFTPIFAFPLMLYHLHIYIIISLCIIFLFFRWSIKYRFYHTMTVPMIRKFKHLKARWSRKRLKTRIYRGINEIVNNNIRWHKIRIHWALIYVGFVFLAPNYYRVAMFLLLAAMRAAPKYYIMILL